MNQLSTKIVRKEATETISYLDEDLRNSANKIL